LLAQAMTAYEAKDYATAKKLVQQSLEKLQQKDMNSANQEQQKMENFWDLL